MDFMLSNPLNGLGSSNAIEALLLGGIGMTAGSAVQETDGTSGNHSLERALALLTESLEIIDALQLSPEIGARLQEVISSLETQNEA